MRRKPKITRDVEQERDERIVLAYIPVVIVVTIVIVFVISLLRAY